MSATNDRAAILRDYEAGAADIRNGDVLLMERFPDGAVKLWHGVIGAFTIAALLERDGYRVTEETAYTERWERTP